MELGAGAGIGFKFLLDECKIGGIGIKSLQKIGVFGAFVGLGDKREKEGNLELNLSDIDTVEEAVEFGVAKGIAEFGVGWGFFGKELLGVIASFLADLGVVSVKAGRSAGESAREGIGDGAKIGRFEIAVIFFEDGIEAGGAIINLVDVFFGIRFGSIDNESDGDDDGEGGEATEDDFGDEAGTWAGGFASDGPRSL